MFSLPEVKFKRSLCSWRRTAKFISADGLYEVPAELRTGPGAARGDGREQGRAVDDVVQGHAGRGSVCTRKFHVEGVDWALYSALVDPWGEAKLVTSPTTIVVGTLNQVHFGIDLTNLLPQLDASTRSRLVWGTRRNSSSPKSRKSSLVWRTRRSSRVWRTRRSSRVCKLTSPRSYGTFRNKSQPRLGCLGRGEIIDSQILGDWNKSSPSGQASKDAMRTILTGQRATST